MFLTNLDSSLVSLLNAVLLVITYSCANTCNNMPTTKPNYEASIFLSGFRSALPPVIIIEWTV